MVQIGDGIGLSQRGDRDAARRVFADIWNRIGPSGDAIHRCALAHSMADVQDDVHEELTWDLRALQAADAVGDERVPQPGVTAPVSSFYPSLHLNLGDADRRIGDVQRARDHLRARPVARHRARR